MNKLLNIYIFKVAIQGCFHGKAEEIFGSIEHI